MTAEIVNLNKARKAKERAAKERHAEENRIRYGRTKAERAQEEALRALETARHDGVRRDKSSPRPGKDADDDDFDPGAAS